MRMLALVTLTLPAEVFEREMLPVVPQGTVTMVAALSDSSWPVAPTVDADSEPGMTAPPDSSAIETATLVPVATATLALYSTR